MIRSFRHRGLERLYGDDDKRGVSANLIPRLRRVLTLLDSASEPLHVDQPGLGLHALKGNRRGQWAVWVSGNWRIVFVFDQGDVIDVGLVDYH